MFVDLFVFLDSIYLTHFSNQLNDYHLLEITYQLLHEFHSVLFVEEELDLYYYLVSFYCFVSDALSGTYSFENFCAEFGYDTDSRTAEKTWKACKRSFDKFWNLTGYSLDMMYDFINELSEVAA